MELPLLVIRQSQQRYKETNTNTNRSTNGNKNTNTNIYKYKVWVEHSLRLENAPFHSHHPFTPSLPYYNCITDVTMNECLQIITCRPDQLMMQRCKSDARCLKMLKKQQMQLLSNEFDPLWLEEVRLPDLLRSCSSCICKSCIHLILPEVMMISVKLGWMMTISNSIEAALRLVLTTVPLANILCHFCRWKWCWLCFCY